MIVYTIINFFFAAGDQCFVVVPASIMSGCTFLFDSMYFRINSKYRQYKTR